MYSLLKTLAATLIGGGGNVDIPELKASDVLHNGLNIAYGIAGIVAVIVIIIGGFMYVTSAGNSASITKAKNMILYSVVGLVVVFCAYAITNFVIGKF